jgi:hypothetical protein
MAFGGIFGLWLRRLYPEPPKPKKTKEGYLSDKEMEEWEEKYMMK